MRFLIKVLLNALALYVADYLLAGIALSSLTAALVAGLVLGFVNALVKPVIFVLTLPITFVTLGLFIFVVNAICLALTASLVPGFDIAGFWTAVAGAFIVSVVSWLLNGLTKDDRRRSAEW